jgi:hypothetical protein
MNQEQDTIVTVSPPNVLLNNEAANIAGSITSQKRVELSPEQEHRQQQNEIKNALHEYASMFSYNRSRADRLKKIAQRKFFAKKHGVVGTAKIARRFMTADIIADKAQSVIEVLVSKLDSKT